MYPKSLENLIDSLKMLPGVGTKTAERYALSILDNDDDKVIELSKAIQAVKENIQYCEVCHNFTERSRCDTCLDTSRDHTTICVVASAKEVFALEKMHNYHGVYHVLDGLISTQKGIMPDDINIASLEARLNSDVKEVILALNATVEGEMTALYIAKKLENKATVTRLAFGLPIGGHLDYADDMTLIKAFEGRSKVE